ncbi:MAG: hypothetical protein WAK17_14125 [Candidatus Nitrosopolaris sp.]|jgi:hypothetical protein
MAAPITAINEPRISYLSGIAPHTIDERTTKVCDVMYPRVSMKCRSCASLYDSGDIIVFLFYIIGLLAVPSRSGASFGLP